MKAGQLRDLPDDFQLEHLRAGLCFVKKFETALDIGAHRGIWTREMLKHFEDVTAIEPSELFYELPVNANRIKAAAGDKKGTCKLIKGLRNTGQSHVVSGDEISMITIDSLKMKVDFIKIDVEGMEYDVLKGAKETIRTHKPVIMIEENGLCQRYGHPPDAPTRLLKAWGFNKILDIYMPPERDRNSLFIFGETK